MPTECWGKVHTLLWSFVTRRVTVNKRRGAIFPAVLSKTAYLVAAKEVAIPFWLPMSLGVKELECPLCDAGTRHCGLVQGGSGELPSGVLGHWTTVAELVAAEHSGGSVVRPAECEEGGIPQRRAGWPPFLGPGGGGGPCA